MEELGSDGTCRLFKVEGVRYCSNHGITEVGKASPRAFGLLTPGKYPAIGQGVWHATLNGERSDAVFKAGPLTTYGTRISSVRWDRAAGRIVPLNDLGESYHAKPFVDRDHGSVIPPDVREKLSVK